MGYNPLDFRLVVLDSRGELIHDICFYSRDEMDDFTASIIREHGCKILRSDDHSIEFYNGSECWLAIWEYV